MVQKVVTLCDRHQAHAEDVDAELPATSLSLIGTLPPVRREIEIDLCPACKQELSTALAVYFTEGRRPTTRTLTSSPRGYAYDADTNTLLTPSGRPSRSKIKPAEDGMFYCDHPSCGRAEWFTDGEGQRRHGRGWDRAQSAVLHRARAAHRY